MTPTARTLAECKRRGWLAEVVERFNVYTKRRKDLFGVIDVVAIIPGKEAIGGFCCVYERPYGAEPGSFTCQTCGVTNTKTPGCIIGIQATSGANHASRRTKAMQEPNIKVWCEAGGMFAVWSWSKRGARGTRKLWRLREERVTP